MYNYEKLPENLQDGMRRYVEQGIKPGHFLTGVLENDLLKAVNYADEDSLREIVNIAKWVYWEIPSGAWGNSAAVKAHIYNTVPSPMNQYRIANTTSDLTPIEKADTVGAEFTEVFGDVHSV